MGNILELRPMRKAAPLMQNTRAHIQEKARPFGPAFSKIISSSF
jgi:hypothetical protein